ncbi:MAG: histidine kinase [Ardenticatenaceae bacterium]|nr:histidine kinase [Ardenticatenaceae bacterium]
MRLMLATSALLIIYLDPLERGRSVASTYTLLGLYILYGTVLYILTLRHSPFLARINTLAHWVDVGWYAALLALGHSTSSIFFFFFFPILVAAFRWGFFSGLWVAVASAVLATSVILVSAASATDFQLNRFLLYPIYLLVLGYMLAYRGGFELTLKQRLALLKEVTRLSNPRFGVDQTIGSIMARLQAFYKADGCLLVTGDPSLDQYRLRRADSRQPEAGAHAEPLPAAVAKRLLALPDNLAVVYHGKPRAWWRPPLGVSDDACDLTSGTHRTVGREVSEALAATLGVEAFVTVPFPYAGEAIGRLYLTAQRPGGFRDVELDFLLQVVEHVTPMIDNVRLVDRLASSAAEEERQRIARDLHDSVIQPYIGLQMGLVATHQKLASGGEVSGELAQLIEMTNVEIADLRGYVRGLKARDGGEDSLLPAVRRFARKFAEATRIDVDVEAKGDLRVNDRLAAEAFQIVAEGLSNVRRHTGASRVTVGLLRQNGHLILRIENEGSGESVPAPFTPRSITERAAALGGRAHVERRADGGSAVVVNIPL